MSAIVPCINLISNQYIGYTVIHNVTRYIMSYLADNTNNKWARLYNLVHLSGMDMVLFYCSVFPYRLDLQYNYDYAPNGERTPEEIKTINVVYNIFNLFFKGMMVCSVANRVKSIIDC